MIHIHHKGTDIYLSAGVPIFPMEGYLSMTEHMTTAAENRKRPPFSTLRMEWMFNKPFDQSSDPIQTRHR